MSLFRTRPRTSITVLFLCAGAQPGLADNGRIAVAQPIAGITVDGDFSDWPKSFPSYTIGRPISGRAPKGTEDFDAAFRVGYDDEALYLAVEVLDDSVVVDPTTGWWRWQDSCAVYLDLGHTGEDIVPLRYRIFGGATAGATSGLAVSGGYRRDATHHRYEWRFELNRMHRPHAKLEPGRVIGLDFMLSEKDTDDELSIASRFAWGPGVNKDTSSANLGDVVLGSPTTELGRLHGRLIDSASTPIARGRARLRNERLSSPLTLASDKHGAFEASLPVGEYRLLKASGEEARRIRVTAAENAPPLNLRVEPEPADPARVAESLVVSAGRGNRIGRLHRYGPEDGLPAGEIRGLTQAPDGALWIASEESGLLRFDGQTIASFGLPADEPQMSCSSLALDESGNVWLTAHRGTRPGELFHFDGTSFTRFSQKGGPSSRVHEITSDRDGRPWVRDDRRIYRHDGGRFEAIYEKVPRQKLLSMAIESPTRVWVGTTHGLVLAEAADPTSPWTATRLDNVNDGAVRALLVDSTQHLWIGTDDGLSRYAEGALTSWTAELGLARVDALAQTADGTIWLGTDQGLVELRDGAFTRVENTPPVTSLFVDREQNVWLAGRGLLRYERPPLAPSMRSQLAERDVTKLLRARDGALWVGTRQGVVRYEGTTSKRVSADEGLLGLVVTALFEDSNGGIWVGTDRGINYFEGEQIVSLGYDDGLGVPSVDAVTEDVTGRIWIATHSGVAIYEPRGRRHRHPNADTDVGLSPDRLSKLSLWDGLPSSEVNAVFTDTEGAVWIATPHGVCRWRYNELRQYDRPKGIRCFVEDASKNVLAGGDGLYRFDGSEWTPVDIGTRIQVRGMAPDPAGRIWLATSAGLKVHDGFATQTLTENDGALDSCTDVIWDASQSLVQVAGARIASYRPEQTSPPIAIRRVVAEEEYEAVASVTLSSSQPFLHVSFNGTSFRTRADALRYRYRLEGFEDDWKLTRDDSVSYGNLPPGDYTFEVYALDRDLNGSSHPAVVAVHVGRDYSGLALWTSVTFALACLALLSVTLVKRHRGVRRLNRHLDKRVRERTAELEREMTEKSRLQSQLLQTQKLDAVGTLASGIAHDLNNSLAAISGFAELAQQRSPEELEHIADLLTAVRQATGTTRSLLTFSRESSKEKVPRNLVETVDQTTGFLSRTLPASIEVSTDFTSDGETWCPIDDVQIQQVLVNLTVNARDALPNGGRIAITVRRHPDQAGLAQIVVSDNGTGMEPEVLERIFDPFFTTKSRGQGTGLGMAIVHGIVEEHDGHVEVESTPGEGTTVTVSLPMCPPVRPTAETPEPRVAGRGESVLIAEDNPEVRRMLELQLASIGFRPIATENGLDALRVLSEEETVRLAILDVDLPGMDGLACQQEIHRQYQGVSTIMTSGLASVDAAQFQTTFLRKPFTRLELLNAIEAALHTDGASSRAGVLIVDDDAAVRRTTEVVLADMGYDVFVADGGSEGIALLRDNREQIGTVLMDWHLPDVDPLAVLKELRSVSPDVRVLIVSGDLTLESQRIEAHGFARLVRKPWTVDELVDSMGNAAPKE